MRYLIEDKEPTNGTKDAALRLESPLNVLAKTVKCVVNRRMEKKILFVDDNKDWRAMVTTALSGAGFEVVTAADASEAMKLANETELRLVILDLNLGGESGLMLMKFIRENHPDLPILLYTGIDHDDGTIAAMLREGADRYLHKGSMDELIETVRKFESLPKARPTG